MSGAERLVRDDRQLLADAVAGTLRTDQQCGQLDAVLIDLQRQVAQLRMVVGGGARGGGLSAQGVELLRVYAVELVDTLDDLAGDA